MISADQLFEPPRVDGFSIGSKTGRRDQFRQPTDIQVARFFNFIIRLRFSLVAHIREDRVHDIMNVLIDHRVSMTVHSEEGRVLLEDLTDRVEYESLL